MEYTELEKIVNPDDGDGGWVDTHPNSDILVEGSATAEMSSEEKVYCLLLFVYYFNHLNNLFPSTTE